MTYMNIKSLLSHSSLDIQIFTSKSLVIISGGKKIQEGFM